MQRRITKEPLSMLFVELKPTVIQIANSNKANSNTTANSKNIHKINFLLKYQVKFEHSYVRYKISQCSRYQ